VAHVTDKTHFVTWNVVFVGGGSDSPGEEALRVYEAFQDEKNQGSK
jgi:hypothetical protein